jgi:hypothetical protein
VDADGMIIVVDAFFASQPRLLTAVHATAYKKPVYKDSGV